jgi:hypothetical protein
MEQYITRFELADGSAVAGTLLSVESRTESPGIVRVTVRVDSDTLGIVSFDARNVTGMSAGKWKLDNPGMETLRKAIFDRIVELRKGPLLKEAERCPYYPGSPGVHAEVPGDTPETDRLRTAMYKNRVHIMESVLRNNEGEVACPALFHLECGDILEEFRRAGFRTMENVDVLAAVQCFVARHLSDMLPGAEWLQEYLDFYHMEELGKLIGNDL